MNKRVAFSERALLYKVEAVVSPLSNLKKAEST